MKKSDTIVLAIIIGLAIALVESGVNQIPNVFVRIVIYIFIAELVIAAKLFLFKWILQTGLCLKVITLGDFYQLKEVNMAYFTMDDALDAVWYVEGGIEVPPFI